MSQNRVSHQAGTNQVLLGDVVHRELDSDHDGGSLCGRDDALKHNSAVKSVNKASPRAASAKHTPLQRVAAKY